MLEMEVAFISNSISGWKYIISLQNSVPASDFSPHCRGVSGVWQFSSNACIRLGHLDAKSKKPLLVSERSMLFIMCRA